MHLNHNSRAHTIHIDDTPEMPSSMNKEHCAAGHYRILLHKVTAFKINIDNIADFSNTQEQTQS